MPQFNAEKVFAVPDARGRGTHESTPVFRNMGDRVLAEAPDERWIGCPVPGSGGLGWHSPSHGAPIDVRAPFVMTP